MKLLILAMSLMAFNVSAANYEQHESSFTIPTHTGSSTRIFYSCDVVEDKVFKMLETMGAIVKDVRCTGGLDRFGRMHMAAHVKVNYETLNSEIDGNIVTSIMTTSIKDNGNCHMLNTSFKAIKKNFEISSSKTSRCNRLNSRTRIKMKVLKAVK